MYNLEGDGMILIPPRVEIIVVEKFINSRIKTIMISSVCCVKTEKINTHTTLHNHIIYSFSAVY